MLPKLTAEQKRRRRAFAKLHNIIVMFSIEVAVAVYMVTKALYSNSPTAWFVGVLTSNYIVVVLMLNRHWFAKKLMGGKN